MKVMLVLKNGFRYSGKLLEETETQIIIADIKLGKTTIEKDSLAARSEVEN